MNVTFPPDSWRQYLYWQDEDRKIRARINELIADIRRNGNRGIGKPEALRQELSGWWSRRITSEHRLVYSLKEGSVQIASCRFHCDKYQLAAGAVSASQSGHLPFGQETDLTQLSTGAGIAAGAFGA